MFHALSWLVVVTLLLFWSLTAWAVHAVALWTASNAGARSGSASGGGDMRLPDWLTSWVPPKVTDAVSELSAALGPVVDKLLQAAPALADGVAVVTGVVWAIGCALLLVLGAALHLLVTLWRRHGGAANN